MRFWGPYVLSWLLMIGGAVLVVVNIPTSIGSGQLNLGIWGGATVAVVGFVIHRIVTHITHRT